MSMDSSPFDCHNQMYGEFTDYPPARPDTSISISAVVSASCVIVNGNHQHHDTGTASQFPFPPDPFIDKPFEGSTHGDQCHSENTTYSERQGYENGDYNQYTSNFTEQIPFCNSIQQPYFHDEQGTASEISGLQHNPFHQDQTPYSYYETTNTINTSACTQKEHCPNVNYDTAFDSRSVYTQPTMSVTTCDSYFPESLPSGRFEPLPCNDDATTPLEKAKHVPDSDTSVDLNVDEMIGNGVTVAGFKPRGIIRKRRKSKTPSDAKDGCYWSKRVKNNDSARRSRETKKDKERNFYKRALELEYENFYLKEKISHLESQLSAFSTDGSSSLNDSFVQ